MSVHERLPRIPMESFGWLMVFALALHGPVDLLITISHRHLESNPVVLALGWELWLAVKVAAIPAAALVWWELRRERRTRAMAYLLATMLLILGELLILPNILVVMGWLG